MNWRASVLKSREQANQILAVIFNSVNMLFSRETPEIITADTETAASINTQVDPALSAGNDGGATKAHRRVACKCSQEAILRKAPCLCQWQAVITG